MAAYQPFGFVVSGRHEKPDLRPSLPPSSSYTTIYLQTGHVRNTGVELSLGYDNQWRNFRWTTNFTYSWNKNEIIELAANAVNPVTGEA